MILVSGTIRYDSGSKDKAVAAVRAVTEATRAEPGNHEYAFSFDALEDGLVRLFEVWEDQASIDVHMTKPHLAEFLAATADFGVTEANIVSYETDGPVEMPISQ